MSASIATPTPAPMAPVTRGEEEVRGRGGIAATEECRRFTVGVLFCDDRKHAEDGARDEPDQRTVGERVVRTVDPDDRRVRDVTALTILRQEHQVVGRECLDAAMPLPALIVGDADLLAFLDTLPDRIGVVGASRSEPREVSPVLQRMIGPERPARTRASS